MRKATGKWHLLGRVTAGSQPASAITDTVIRGLSTLNNVKYTAVDGTAVGKFRKHVICVVECRRDKYKNTTNDNRAPKCLFYADMEKKDHYFHSSSMVLFERNPPHYC